MNQESFVLIMLNNMLFARTSLSREDVAQAVERAFTAFNLCEDRKYEPWRLPEVPVPLPPSTDLERQEFLRESSKAPSQEECAEILREAAEPPKKRGRPAKAKGVEQAPAQVTICTPEPEIQPHHHELAADLGGTVVSLKPDDEVFSATNPEHKAIVLQWAKEAAVDAMWKKCYGAHIMALCHGKMCSQVYPILDEFMRSVLASERLQADYQKNIVGK